MTPSIKKRYNYYLQVAVYQRLELFFHYRGFFFTCFVAFFTIFVFMKKLLTLLFIAVSLISCTPKRVLVQLEAA